MPQAILTARCVRTDPTFPSSTRFWASIVTYDRQRVDVLDPNETPPLRCRMTCVDSPHTPITLHLISL